MTTNLTFTTRTGQTFTVEVIEDIGHAVRGKVIAGRKSFLGKTLVFPKNDMARAA